MRYIMSGYSNYEMLVQNRNGTSARTWRSKQAPSAAVQLGAQPAQLGGSVRIVDADDQAQACVRVS